MEYLDPERAREMPGLRLVLTAGVPGPWGEAAKAIFAVKEISYLPVRQDAGCANEALVAWTGQDNAPQAVYESERARSGWAEILLLAERLVPEPALIPADPHERAQMFGLCHELCGEGGFGWCRRLTLLDPILRNDMGEPNPALEGPRRLARKYGYSPAAARAAGQRVKEIVLLLSQQWQAQRAKRRRYLLGETLSALDLYWAAFAALVEPLPAEVCPMSDLMRQAYTLTDPELRKALDPDLLEHRDFVYREHVGLPLEF